MRGIPGDPSKQAVGSDPALKGFANYEDVPWTSEFMMNYLYVDHRKISSGRDIEQIIRVMESSYDIIEHIFYVNLDSDNRIEYCPLNTGISRGNEFDNSCQDIITYDIPNITFMVTIIEYNSNLFDITIMLNYSTVNSFDEIYLMEFIKFSYRKECTVIDTVILFEEER
ncbi:MAG: hypothetical protein QCI82_04385 [Candidatus Thermoplasmatota archaeon]|nr:hypothetical protein [Candidatus Thermoplasmatota archaeon]